jgi:ATP-dependent DNA helicase RecG
MTLDDVHDIVQGGESAQVEFKRSTGQRTAAAKTVCGMLNGQGGYVLFGVKDDGTVVGQEVADDTRQDVARELGKIEPQVVLDPDVVPVEGERSVIVISVPGDRRGPYAYDGRPYVRQGPTTRPMEQSTYEARLVENRDPRRRWERQRPSSLRAIV